MKRIRARAAVLLLLTASAGTLLRGPAAFGGAHEQKEGAMHAPTDAASIAAGHKIYTQFCVPCHGAGGHGDGPAGVALKPRPRDFNVPKAFKSKNDGELFEVVNKGGASEKLSALMPAWGGTLNKAQIWDVIAYVRGFPARDSLAKAHAAK
jgi:high-affinity iron transporter